MSSALQSWALKPVVDYIRIGWKPYTTQLHLLYQAGPIFIYARFKVAKILLYISRVQNNMKMTYGMNPTQNLL